MKIITINLPPSYLLSLQRLVDAGVYPSRSEAVRIAVREQLSEDFKLQDSLEKSESSLCLKGRGL